MPRADVRELENRFKVVEDAVRSAEDGKGGPANPEAHARASETVQKLEASLDALRAGLAKAQAAGNAKQVAEAEAAIQARQVWLDQARKSLSELG